MYQICLIICQYHNNHWYTYTQKQNENPYNGMQAVQNQNNKIKLNHKTRNALSKVTHFPLNEKSSIHVLICTHIGCLKKVMNYYISG